MLSGPGAQDFSLLKVSSLLIMVKNAASVLQYFEKKRDMSACLILAQKF